MNMKHPKPIRNNDWYRENCKLDLDKSKCPKMKNSEDYECEDCLNHLPNVSPKVYAFQCDICGYRQVCGNPEIQDSNCEMCKTGVMKSKDLENNMFQDSRRR